MRSPCCLCVSVSPPPINFQMPEPIFMILGMYIMAPELISTVYFINPSHQSVRVYVAPIVDMQRLGENVTAATNTYTAIEELLDSSLSMRSAWYQRNQGDSFFPELLVNKSTRETSVHSKRVPGRRPGQHWLTTSLTITTIWVVSKQGRPPLWASGQSFWLQIQRSWVRFPALPDFVRSSGSGTGSTQPREDN
jgi:hypothetical protein